MNYQQSVIYGGQQDNTQWQYNQQQQQFKQQENQVEVQEQRFAVFQDLQYTINLFSSLIGIMEYFKDDPKHPMVTTATNKLIVQLCLSNTIHYDLQTTSEDNSFLNNNLKMLNGKALEIFSHWVAQQNWPQDLIQYINFYRGNLSSHTQIQSIPLKPTNRAAEFNQAVVQRLFAAMNTTDEVYKNIRQGDRVQSPTKYSVQRTALEYLRHILSKIQDNFPKIQETQNNYPQSRFQQSPHSEIIIRKKNSLQEQFREQNKQSPNTQQYQYLYQQEQEQLKQENQQSPLQFSELQQKHQQKLQNYQKQQQKQQLKEQQQQQYRFQQQQFHNEQQNHQFQQQQYNQQHQNSQFIGKQEFKQQQIHYPSQISLKNKQRSPKELNQQRKFNFIANTEQQLQQDQQPQDQNYKRKFNFIANTEQQLQQDQQPQDYNYKRKFNFIANTEQQLQQDQQPQDYNYKRK